MRKQIITAAPKIVNARQAKGHAINQRFINGVRNGVRRPGYALGDSVVVNQGGGYEILLPGHGGRYERNPLSVLGNLSGAFTFQYRAARPGNTTEQMRDEQIPDMVGYPPGIVFVCFTHNNSGTGDTPQGWSGSEAGILARYTAMAEIVRRLQDMGHCVVLVHLAPRNGATSSLKQDIQYAKEVMHQVAEDYGCLAVLDSATDAYLMDLDGNWRDVALEGDGVHPSGSGLNVIGMVLYRLWLAAGLPTNKQLPNALSDTIPVRHSILDGDGMFDGYTAGSPPDGWITRLTAATHNAPVPPVNGNAKSDWWSLTTPAASTGVYRNLTPTTESGSATDVEEGAWVRTFGRIKGDFAANTGRGLQIVFSNGMDLWYNGLPINTPWWEDFDTWDGYIFDFWYYVNAAVTSGQMRFDITGSAVGEVRVADLDCVVYSRQAIQDCYPWEAFEAKLAS